MLYSFLVFLPVAVCLFWIAIHCMMAYRTKTFASIIVLLASLSVYLFADACYADSFTPPTTLLITSLLAQLFVPSIIPLAGIYISRLRSDRHLHWRQFLWIVFPSILFSTALVILLLAGADRIMAHLESIYAHQFDSSIRETAPLVYAYYLVTNRMLRAVVFIEILGEGAKMLVIMFRDNLRIRHFRKFFAGEHIRVLELQFFLIILSFVFLLAKNLLSRDILVERPWLTMLLSFALTICTFFFGYVALFGARFTISIREMHSAFRFNFNKTTRAGLEEEILADMVASAGESVLRNTQLRITQRLQENRLRELEQEEGHPSAAASLHAVVSASWSDDSLLSRFEEYIFGQKGFLEPGITLIGVAEKLHSNKTYISRLVNSTYNMPFPDLINTLRIEFAQQYLADHRNAHQNEVAQACGFASASSFNNIFKKVAGMTPKIWLATHD